MTVHPLQMLLRGLTVAAFSSNSAMWKITRQSNFGAELGDAGFGGGGAGGEWFGFLLGNRRESWGQLTGFL